MCVPTNQILDKYDTSSSFFVVVLFAERRGQLLISGADVACRTISRHFSRLGAILANAFRGPFMADLIWSVHRIGGLLRGLFPFALPCTTRRSMESLFLLET